MKYYPQRNLAARAKLERLSVPEVLAIGVRIACAVETAHRAGILHRDIKPANILTSQYGEPGLTDFGIATTKDETTGSAEGMSIPWSPPEVVFATAPADARSDIYSLGATLWHLLVGRSPFDVPGGDNSSFAMMRRIREQPPPHTGREDVPAALERVLAQAMSKDPANRPSTALSLARSLQAIERAERWAPTPLVLLDETLDAEAEALPEEEGAADERTRLRSPQVVVAQPPSPVPPVPPPPGLAPRPAAPPRQRVMAPQVPAVPADPALELTTSAEGLTVALVRADGAPRAAASRLRAGRPVAPAVPAAAPPATPPATPVAVPRPQPPAVAPSPRAATPAEGEAPRGRRPNSLIIAAAAALVVVLGAVAILAAHAVGGGRQATPSNTPISTPSQNAIPDAGAPGTPQVTWIRSGTQVTFSWTYADPLAGDDFQWRIVSNAWTPTTVPSATVTVPLGHEVCIEVEVGRADGTSFSQTSAPTCGG
jgi:hypothetical protein